MASPIQLIKEGFLSGDWSLVQEAYVLLTGENLIKEEYSTPKKRGRKPKQATEVAVKVKAKDPTTVTVNAPVQLCPTGKRTIEFITMEASPEEAKADALLYKGKPRVERREKVQKVQVHCGRCHRSYDVYPAFVPPVDSDYICDKCIGK